MVVLDKQAFFRQSELAAKLGEEQGNEPDGDIAFLISGGGYGLSSLEQLTREGGNIALARNHAHLDALPLEFGFFTGHMYLFS